MRYNKQLSTIALTLYLLAGTSFAAVWQKKDDQKPPPKDKADIISTDKEKKNPPRDKDKPQNDDKNRDKGKKDKP